MGSSQEVYSPLSVLPVLSNRIKNEKSLTFAPCRDDTDDPFEHLLRLWVTQISIWLASHGIRRQQSTIARLRSGHSLNLRLHRIGTKDFSECMCRIEIDHTVWETAEHFLCACRLYEAPRKKCFGQSVNCVAFQTIAIAWRRGLDKDVQLEISDIVYKLLCETGRFL